MQAMTQKSTYIHGTSEDEQQRLSLMNDVLLNRESLQEMRLRGDERILDFGSGLGQFTRAMARAVPRGKVVGIERDPVQLAAAKRIAEADGEGSLVEWRQDDVLDLQSASMSDWGTFDVAHTRFLLEHLPDPLRVVKSMVASVKRGGRIVLADDDHGAMRLWPEPPGFSDLWLSYIRSYDRIGNDPYAGRRLVQLLHEAGAKPLRNRWIFFGGCAGMEHFDVLAANMWGVLRTARDTMISMNLCDATTFDAVEKAYKQWALRPDAAIWFAMSWAEGIRA
jgi:SAM-dependent methyltransferase